MKHKTVLFFCFCFTPELLWIQRPVKLSSSHDVNLKHQRIQLTITECFWLLDMEA